MNSSLFSKYVSVLLAPVGLSRSAGALFSWYYNNLIEIAG